jgi:hypothetical protein
MFQCLNILNILLFNYSLKYAIKITIIFMVMIMSIFKSKNTNEFIALITLKIYLMS